ncbi:MAG: class I SAM-dependent methyltransferase [Candidatus Sericytochromatia bacterium]|nr:class I SAM-dependent methyltransferase [Candidatus Sericytochromatia bacterium]
MPNSRYTPLRRWGPDWRRLVIRQLTHLQAGEITLVDGTKTRTYGRATSDCPLRATVTVLDPRFYRIIAWRGTTGSGEAFMDGLWTCDDLTALMRILLRNEAVMNRIDYRLASLLAPIDRLLHAFRRNTVNGSRKNIAAHYDLGNEFYSLFLDETLAYSCGIFDTPETTLVQASRNKFDRICAKLQLTSADHLLEIGTGWGGLAIHAARHYGCRVTTTTISREQFDLAVARIAEAGLTDRITVLLADYRDLTGRYDKVVSVEMIEAIGAEYYETFFRTCATLMRPEGLLLIQAITFPDQVFERARLEVDFIKRYIFPGCCIPSVKAMNDAVCSSSDMRMVNAEDITPHYALTLRHWRRRFFDNLPAIRALGYSESFIRMWEYYFCWCEAGFTERYIGDVQLLYARPMSRHVPFLPPVHVWQSHAISTMAGH